MSSALNTPYPASILARIQRYRSYQEMKHIIKKIIKKIIIKEERKKQRENLAWDIFLRKIKWEHKANDSENVSYCVLSNTLLGRRSHIFFFHRNVYLLINYWVKKILSKICYNEDALKLSVFFIAKIIFIICIFTHE